MSHSGKLNQTACAPSAPHVSECLSRFTFTFATNMQTVCTLSCHVLGRIYQNFFCNDALSSFLHATGNSTRMNITDRKFLVIYLPSVETYSQNSHFKCQNQNETDKTIHISKSFFVNS